MSVPRPAMLVAMVTAPLRPACATIEASRSWYLALSTTWGTPLRLSSLESISLFSIEMVPTRAPAGPALGSRRSPPTTAFHFSCSVR